MTFLLRLFSLDIESIESLGLDNLDRLSSLAEKVREFDVARGVDYFGRGDRLKEFDAERIASELGKPGSYTFADVPDPSEARPKIEWTLGLREGMVSVSAVVEAEPGHQDSLRQELVQLNELLLDSVSEFDVGQPFSVLDAIEVDFEPSGAPRYFGRIPARSLVDIVYVPGPFEGPENAVVESLRDGNLIDEALREVVGDLLVVTWGNVESQPVEEILAARYAWYVEQGEIPKEQAENEHGDSEFALYQPKRTSQLTGYSELDKTGMKGVVFDDPEEVEATLEDLGAILESGTTAEGHPVDEIAVVVPRREQALELRPLAERYGLRVAYVGVDDRLWEPQARRDASG
jgi:hypothetical protein